ncbi:METL4 protein, partial [Upupa epops]|nr:METL4 protein [Upupa epops]
MSVVLGLAAGWLLDHLAFINRSGYELRGPCAGLGSPFAPGTPAGHGPAASAAERDGSGSVAAARAAASPARFVFREEFFSIARPYLAAALPERPGRGCPQRCLTDAAAVCSPQKRKRKCVFNQGELDALEYHEKVRTLISEGTSLLVQEGLRTGFLHHAAAEAGCRRSAVPGHAGCELAELCGMAKQFPAESHRRAVQVLSEETSIPEQDLLSCVTENSSNCAQIVVLMGQKYLVPPKSSFLLSDISCLQPLLDYKRNYGVIVIDPPWENKSVKRSNRYSYLASWKIKQIPVPALAAPDCLVVTWVTNRQKHLRFVKDELYPHWCVKTLAEWHWVKITTAGEFVLPLDSSHKKPYEVLVLGRVQGLLKEALREPEEAPPIPEHKLLVSVPCSLHSHKPPLAAVLAEFVKPDVECLELFARNLQPGWTSWGNEVLKFQHIDYFTLRHSD